MMVNFYVFLYVQVCVLTLLNKSEVLIVLLVMNRSSKYLPCQNHNVFVVDCIFAHDAFSLFSSVAEISLGAHRSKREGTNQLKNRPG